MKRKLLVLQTDLYQKYVIERKSCRTIAKELGVGKTTINNYLVEYAIPIRKNIEVRKGMKFSDEWRANISKNHADVSGKNCHFYGERRIGPANHRWKGGKTSLIHRVRGLTKNIEWRLAVFARDHFTCLWCNDSTGHNLNADHIIPLSFLLKKNNVTSIEEALACSELWDINNGRTLCESCHKKTDTWGTKAYKYIRS